MKRLPFTGRAAAAAAIALAIVAATAPRPLTAQAPAVYRPALKDPEFLDPFRPTLAPGADAFTNEPAAKAIEARLRQFGDALRKGASAASADAAALVAATARGREPDRDGPPRRACERGARSRRRPARGGSHHGADAGADHRVPGDGDRAGR